MISLQSEPALSTRRLTEADFAGMQREWQALLERSRTDRLFMSWEWLSAWWETWSRALGLELFLVAAYEDDRLVGLAPCFRYQRPLRRGVTLSELHFIGNAWHIAPTVRTEYVDLIVDRERQDAATELLSGHLRDECWDLMVLCDHTPSHGTAAFAHLQGRLGLKGAPRSADVGVCVDTAGSFEQWLAGLGPNTRLKAYNRRCYLAGLGMAPTLAREPDPGSALALLNGFHEKRWGKPCFQGPSLDFHRRFIARLNTRQSVNFSVLTIAGRPRSILYDVRIGSSIYNLQAGFEEHFDRKISLGTLHLGYALEAAFTEPAVTSYDLLAGEGKNCFYKAHFNGEQVFFQTGHYLRRNWLKAAAMVYQALPRQVSRPVLRWLDAPVSGRF